MIVVAMQPEAFRAEISLPIPASLHTPDEEGLDRYQQKFRTHMEAEAARLRTLFGSLIVATTPGIGTMNVCATTDQIHEILEESHGHVIASHPWEGALEEIRAA